MIKLGDNEVAAIPGTVAEEDFFNMCEAFTKDQFAKTDELQPFSMFWVHGRMLIATWNFKDVYAKNVAMGQARHMCKQLGVTKYFFASEVWMKAIKVDDPEKDSKIKKINNSGVENEPGRIEQLMLVEESKGEKTISIHYDIVPNGSSRKLMNRRVLDEHFEGRAIGILE